MLLPQQRSEETDPYCLPPLDAAAMVYDAPWRRFGVFGDSLSAGTGDSREGYGAGGWPVRVAGVLRRVRPGLRYLNTAADGATTGEALAEQFDGIREFGPDLLHLPCGANDLLRRAPDFGAIEDELRRMYALASATGALLTTFTLARVYVVPAFPDWFRRVERLNDLVRTVAAAHRAVVVDMWDHPVNSRTDLLSADGIHFAAPGQAVLATEVVKALAHALSRADAG